MASKSDPAKIAFTTFECSDGESDTSLNPVIFLHGVTCSKETWDDIPQIVADKTKRKVYACDARNHGESDYTDHVHFDDNIIDLFHFMDTMDIPKAVLIGHSMGGITATFAALTKPERVEMVFSEDIFINKLSKELLIPGIICIKAWAEGVKHVPKDCKESDAVKACLDIMCSQIPDDHPFAATMSSFYKAKLLLRKEADGTYVLNYNHKALLEKLENNPEDLMSDAPPGTYEGPTIFIYGGNSPFTMGGDEEAIKKKLPNAVFIKVPEATHNLHVEFPDEFTNTVLKYLQI